MTEPVDSVPAVLAAAAGVMAVEDVTDGVAPGNSLRLRGRLLLPSDEAYALLAERLRPLGRTPLLRKRQGEDREEVLALPMTFAETAPRVELALIFFALTLISCLFVGAQMWEWVIASGRLNLNLLDGLPFAASMLAILVAHEFGHYLTARHLGSSTSLPYFIGVCGLGRAAGDGAELDPGRAVGRRAHRLCAARPEGRAGRHVDRVGRAGRVVIPLAGLVAVAGAGLAVWPAARPAAR
jgi:hypothetical protein